MDAFTYESITGLKNYYGFKSLLKNGLYTSRFACDDNTIVFNRIISIISPVTLLPNQVGVILNMSSSYGSVTAGLYFQDLASTFNVNNLSIAIQPNQLVYGQVFIGSIIPSSFFGVNNQITFAIFDLY